MIIRIDDCGKIAYGLSVLTLFLALEQGSMIAQARAEPLRPLWVMNADGTGSRHFVRAPGMNPHGSPDWSPVGDKVAFDAWEESDSHRDSRIFVVDADGRSPVEIGRGAMPSWSPDGKQIAFHHYDSNRGIWIMNADGSGRTQLTTRGISPRWSPDGNRIAYADGGLMVLDTIEGTTRKVLSRQANIGFSWAPDGTRLCVQSRVSKRSNDLLIVDADGTNDFRVRYRGDVGNFMDWSPDGHKIAIYVHEAKRFFIIDPDGDQPPTLLEGQDPGRQNVAPSWSPDGKRLVFMSAPLRDALP